MIYGQLGTIKNKIMHAGISRAIKELQNLYSWNQFYQERKMKPQMSKCQAQIKTKRIDINELKRITNKR